MLVLVYGHGAIDTVYAVPKCSPGRSRPLLPCAPLLHCQRVHQTNAGKLAMLPDILTTGRQYVLSALFVFSAENKSTMVTRGGKHVGSERITRARDGQQ